jgi:hypothetical protein
MRGRGAGSGASLLDVGEAGGDHRSLWVAASGLVGSIVHPSRCSRVSTSAGVRSAVRGQPSDHRRRVVGRRPHAAGRGDDERGGAATAGISPVWEMRRIVGQSLTGTAGLEASSLIIVARDARRAGDALPAAIRARDPEQARRAMHDHIEQTQEDLRPYVLKTEPPGHAA